MSTITVPVLTEDGEQAWAYSFFGQLRCPDCSSIHADENGVEDALYVLVPLEGPERCWDCAVLLVEDSACGPDEG